ncbi:MAG: hypothetical protein ABI846_11370 [Rudaea sp.]
MPTAGLLGEYFRAGARWVAAPKPLMADDLYATTDNAATDYDYARHGLLTELEAAFDAACFLCCQRDHFFWQPDLVSNRLGADWLRRHLGRIFRSTRLASASASRPTSTRRSCPCGRAPCS